MAILQIWHICQLCDRGIILDLCCFCDITKGRTTQLHVLVHTYSEMVQKKETLLFSLLENRQNQPCQPLFHQSGQSFLTRSNWNAWRQTVFRLHHLCVAAIADNSPRCCVSLHRCQITVICCERLLRCESTLEILRRCGLFRTVMNAFCLISPGGLFHPNSSWPLKVALSHILNVCFDSCCVFFSHGTLPETKANRSNSSDTPVHMTKEYLYFSAAQVAPLQHQLGIYSMSELELQLLIIFCRWVSALPAPKSPQLGVFMGRNDKGSMASCSRSEVMREVSSPSALRSFSTPGKLKKK